MQIKWTYQYRDSNTRKKWKNAHQKWEHASGAAIAAAALMNKYAKLDSGQDPVHPFNPHWGLIETRIVACL